MMTLTIIATALLAGVTLLIGLSILIYQHYRYRRNSIDWGDLERYDTPLELLPPGSNNSSFRSYKYSQLVAKQEGQRKYSHNSQRQSVGNIEIGRHRQSRSSTKSCPVGMFTYPAQEFRVNQEQQWVQPYYYYRQVVVDPYVSTKTRHSLPEVVSKYNTNYSNNNNKNSLYPNYNSNIKSSSSGTLDPNQGAFHSGHSGGNNNTRNLLLRKYQEKPTVLIEGEIDQRIGSHHKRSRSSRYQNIPHPVTTTKVQQGIQDLLLLKERSTFGRGSGCDEMLFHQSRSIPPANGPIPNARLNRTFSISSQGQIEAAARKGHRGSSPAIRTYNPDGFSFDVTSPPDSPPPTYTGSRSPSPLHIRAASLDIHRSGSPCPDLRGTSPLGETNFHTQHSSHSMDSYPVGKAPMLSPNSLCVRRASRCLSPLYIPPTSPKSPADGNSSCSSGPLSPSPHFGSLQLDLYLTKKEVTIFIDAYKRITNLSDDSNNKGKEAGKNGVVTTYSPNKKSNAHGSLGRLHFRLKYDMDRSDLDLHVIEAHDLAKGDQGGFNDPYIRVFISPEVDTRKRETEIHHNESNPHFDSKFKFPVSMEDLKEKFLILQVLDNDKYSRKDVVGEVSFSLDEFDITTQLEVWAEIVQNKKPSGEKQEIEISLSYLPSAERLTVVLQQARNLHTPENKDTIDPFVKVYLLGVETKENKDGTKETKTLKKKKKKTTARKNSTNPVWNEAFTYPISLSSLTTGAIEICVLDQSNDLIGNKPALIGSCMIGPHVKGSELAHWQKMCQNFRQTITMWHVLT